MNRPGANSRIRAVVLGYIVRGPLGGLAWHHLQYVMGLAALGHEVLFLEDSDDYPSCYDPSQDAVGNDPRYGLQFAEDAFKRIGLSRSWAYYDAPAARWMGPVAQDALRFCEEADLLLNVSGVNPLRPWFERISVRALIDTDPVFTQIRHLTEPAAMTMARAHTRFFTFGENSGRPGCLIPDDGLPWRPIRQPVVLDAWPVTPGPRDGRFTTVMQWESYPPREYAGRTFGMKSDSFPHVMSLPGRTTETLELAVGSPTAPRKELEKAGWLLQDPLAVTRDPWTYQRYIAGSKGEFSVAKQAYAASLSGWFSERSAAYLASGRPVVIQETGASSWLPPGAGIHYYRTIEEAAAALGDVSGSYERECRAARECAGAFDSRQVLAKLIEDCFACSDLLYCGAA